MGTAGIIDQDLHLLGELSNQRGKRLDTGSLGNVKNVAVSRRCSDSNCLGCDLLQPVQPSGTQYKIAAECSKCAGGCRAKTGRSPRDDHPLTVQVHNRISAYLLSGATSNRKGQR